MARGAAAATLLRAVALLGLLVLALLLPGLTPAAPAPGPRPAVVAGVTHGAALLAERRVGQPFLEADEQELDEEDSRAVEVCARAVALRDDSTSSLLPAATDDRPACLERLLALPIRGPPSA